MMDIQSILTLGLTDMQQITEVGKSIQHTTINIIYSTKGIIQYQINSITYEYKIRPLYPNKYNTQQKITYIILIPKYNTPNNRMIHKYEICSQYPTKYNIQQQTTNPQTTQPIPKPKYKIHTQNKKHRKHHHTLPNHPPNPKYLQPHSKTKLQTKHRKYLKQILHPTNKIHPKGTFFPKRSSHPKQKIHPNSKTYPQDKLHPKHNPHPTSKQ